MKNKRKLSPARFFNSKLTATISISLVLFLLGLLLFLFLFANNLSKYVKENLSFDIVLTDEMSETQIIRLQRQLEASDFAKSVSYVSKEDAAKQLEDELGENPEAFLGFNPLPAILVVNLNAQYADADSLPIIEKQIHGFSDEIKNIEYRKELIEKINDNLTKVGFVLLGLSVLLLFISFALINNTIRLMIYSKRFLIHTMKLVGATPGFIRGPFVRSNILLGVFAAIIAMGLLVWLLLYAAVDVQRVTEIISLEYLGVIFGSILLLGIIISYVATYFAVNKYIRMDGDELFYL